MKTVEQRFLEKVAKTRKCWVWIASRVRGYGQFRALGEHRAHRVSYVLYRGKVPEGMKVLHRCDNPLCVNPAHLFLGTNKENSEDMVAKRRQACGSRNGSKLYPERLVRGEQHHQTHLTEADVLTIRKAYRKGVRGHGYDSLAKRFSVDKATIARIVKRKYWSHV